MVFQNFKSYFNPTFAAAENGGENPMVSNRSALKDFLTSIAGMTGDLSNITAPPFVLDTKSVVEIPAFWAENPAMFIAPATSDDPAERALLVLKGFLGGIKSQCYMGHSEEEGVKKPLNAFLGELFIGHWEEENSGTTHLVSEQVSHHPPITACRVWNPQHGVVAEGFNRQKVTFAMSSLSVHIESTGFALKTLEKYDESYLLPLPDFRVKGVLSGAPYPETSGDWYIPSTNGYTSKISFSGGKGFLGGGKKHEFHAVLYKEEDGPKHAIYSIEGCWNSEFTIRDECSGKDIEVYSVANEKANLPQLQLSPVEEMDPWETRRAWHDVQEAIRNNNFNGVKNAKSHLEQGQRDMRKEEERNGTTWKQVFFKKGSSHDRVQSLMSRTPGQDFAKTIEASKGVWLFDSEAWEHAERPYHADLEPDNLKEGEERIYKNGSRASFQSSRGNTPRGSIDQGRASVDLGRMSIDQRRRSVDQGRRSVDQGRPNIDGAIGGGTVSSPRSMPKVDEKIGAVEDGRPADVNGTKMDVGREPEKKHIEGITKDQPMQQHSQIRNKEEELGSGIEGLSVKEKAATEDMLRDMYSSGK